MAVLRPFPVFAAYDDNGNPLALGKVYTYVVNTTTPKSTYTDKTEGASNANPTILDAAGRANIWFNGPTKVVLKDSADVTIATVDDIGTVDEFTTLQSESSTPATAGQIRLASADTIQWRNNANGANVSLSKDTSDNVTVPRFAVSTGIGQGGGVKHQRVVATATGAGANATATTTITWTVAFADANYTCIATLQDSAIAGAHLTHTATKLAGSIIVEITNGPAGGAAGGTINVIAFHD